jgi:hypothetical protein
MAVIYRKHLKTCGADVPNHLELLARIHHKVVAAVVEQRQLKVVSSTVLREWWCFIRPIVLDSLAVVFGIVHILKDGRS